jgi:HSP20 family protein
MAIRFPLLARPRFLNEAIDELLDWPLGPMPVTDGKLPLRYPAIDLRDEEKDLILTAALPDVKPEDVDLTIDGQTLTLRAETRSQEEIEDSHYLMRERRYGSFRRVVELPTRIDADRTTAALEHGVLTVRLPKAEGSDTKKVAVQTAA